METILFTGTSSRKHIDHYEHPQMEAEVTPSMVICDGVDGWGMPQVHMGLLLRCQPVQLLEDTPDETKALTPFDLFRGGPMEFDPIRLWRAIQFVEALTCIDTQTFTLGLFVAAGRYPPDVAADQQHVLQHVVQKLTSHLSYAEIMARPVPPCVIQIAVDMAHGVFKDRLELGSITDEIEAGTLRWSQDLKRIGVVHPDYRRAILQAKDTLATRYRHYLSSYAAFMNYDYTGNSYDDSFIMSCIEWRLYKTIERGIEQSYGADVTFLLSTLLEMCEFDEVVTEQQEEHPVAEIAHRFSLPTRGQRAEELVTWFLQAFSREVNSGQLLTRTRESYLELLHTLFTRWPILPVTQPLVE